MIENVLRNLGGIGLFGITSVCLFFAFFTGMLLWAFRLKGGYLKTMQSLPLDGDSDEPGRSNSDGPVPDSLPKGGEAVPTSTRTGDFRRTDL
jgi:hypothetical protein